MPLESEDPPTKRCRVCGDRALNFNFCGLSCQSCKAFFSRNALDPRPRACAKTNKCSITVATRKQCVACRLKKCAEIGMRKELIAYKKNKMRADENLLEGGIKQEVEYRASLIETIDPQTAGIPRSLVPSLADYDAQLFNRSLELTEAEAEVLRAVKEANRRLWDESRMIRSNMSTTLMEALNSLVYYVRSYIAFTNSFEEFRCLERHDQLAVLKVFFGRSTSLRFIFNYDWCLLAHPMACSESGDQMLMVPTQIYYDVMDEENVARCKLIIRHVYETLEHDENIRDILNVILLFQQVDQASCPEFLTHYAYYYKHLLKRYLVTKCGSFERALTKFARINTILGVFSEMTNITSTDIFSRIDRNQLNQIVVEIFGLL